MSVNYFVFGDNTANIAACKNPIHHTRLHQINARVYCIRDFIKGQSVHHVLCTTFIQHADLCTMAVPAPLLQRHTDVAYGERESE